MAYENLPIFVSHMFELTSSQRSWREEGHRERENRSSKTNLSARYRIS